MNLNKLKEKKKPIGNRNNSYLYTVKIKRREDEKKKTIENDVYMYV